MLYRGSKMSKKKLIVLIIVILDIVIIGILGFYLLKPEKKANKPKPEVVFTYDDLSLKESTIEVNSEKIEEVKISVTINGVGALTATA